MKHDILQQLSRHIFENKSAAVVTRLPEGTQCLLSPEGQCGELSLSPQEIAAANRLLSERRSAYISDEPRIFVRTYARPYRLVIIGAVHIARYLAPMAQMANFEVVVIDPREAFNNAFNVPGTTLIDDWPDDVLKQMNIDESTAIVTLTHDPKIDDVALAIALPSPAFYIGSLGSKRTHEKRKQRLAELGLETRTDRIAAPVGLDLGGREPAEIAVSILAQIIQRRYAP
ncbi:XdhC family protein [Noviherbaspirillum sp.]|uniref:XdhC family protein n=1 Tax=Noviherbaspirillum sp. TaxID=1926288 RepID=UPI002B478C26|nr:XdhC family protein [Noviherbaspirillum sp.]HJV81985.1 XdhC family protein [Noviherbaspirillum sp.]